MRDKRQKFQELAEKRVNRALESLRLVGNLSNTSNYDYSPEEAKRITSALQQEVNSLKNKFELGLQKSDKRFTLGK